MELGEGYLSSGRAHLDHCDLITFGLLVEGGPYRGSLGNRPGRFVRTIEPGNPGVNRGGHIGVFRKKMAAAFEPVGLCGR